MFSSIFFRKKFLFCFKLQNWLHFGLIKLRTDQIHSKGIWKTCLFCEHATPNEWIQWLWVLIVLHKYMCVNILYIKIHFTIFNSFCIVKETGFTKKTRVSSTRQQKKEVVFNMREWISSFKYIYFLYQCVKSN